MTNRAIDTARNLIADLSMLPDVRIDPCCEPDALREIVSTITSAKQELARKMIEAAQDEESVATAVREMYEVARDEGLEVE